MPQDPLPTLSDDLLAGWGYNALKESRKGDLNETAPRWERLRTRSSPHGLNNSRPPLRGPGSTPAWNQGDPPCEFPPGPPGPRQGWAAGLDRFWLLELRVSQHFTVHLFRPWILSSEGRGRKLSWRANALDLPLPRVLFVAALTGSSGVLRSFFKVIARPADGNEGIQGLEVQGGWYGELA